ncbi:MAG: hypothetical protein WB681_00685 [Candidatus Cybelea sp.]
MQRPDDPKAPSFIQPAFEPEQNVTENKDHTACVANLSRMPGVVITRTCEANKPYSKRVPPFIHVAPLRPLNHFGTDRHTGRPFYELVLRGFPGAHPDEEPGQCYRYMALEPCPDHGLPDGGIVCFREIQAVPLGKLLGADKITRLSIETVRVLDQRLAMYFGQTEADNEGDAAPLGDDSPVVRSHKRRIVEQAERARNLGRKT